MGYLWSVLSPLLIMIVMVIVFSNLFLSDIQYFPVYLLIGYMLFSFMSNSSTRALASVVQNAGILKKIYVPKYIFTLASVTSEFVNFFFSLGALLLVMLITGTPITWRFFLVIIPIIQLYVFCIGTGLFLAQITVFFRDVMHIWSVVITAWMYLSAIFYPVTILPEKMQNIISNYNPLYFYITMFRNFTIGGPGMGGTNYAVRGAIAAGLMLLIGIISFSRNKNKFILYL